MVPLCNNLTKKIGAVGSVAWGEVMVVDWCGDVVGVELCGEVMDVDWCGLVW